MSYVICELCTGMDLGGCAGGCRDVCPVDCIQKGVIVQGSRVAAKFFIDSTACLGCGRCEAVCAEGAILAEESLPPLRQRAAATTAAFFQTGLRIED